MRQPGISERCVERGTKRTPADGFCCVELVAKAKNYKWHKELQGNDLDAEVFALYLSCMEASSSFICLVTFERQLLGQRDQRSITSNSAASLSNLPEFQIYPLSPATRGKHIQEQAKLLTFSATTEEPASEPGHAKLRTYVSNICTDLGAAFNERHPRFSAHVFFYIPSTAFISRLHKTW